MQALVLTQPFSGAMPLFQTLMKPQPGPGEVLLRIAAGALNHLEVLWTSKREPFPGLKENLILGSDGAGVVAEVGAGVAEWRPGDEALLLNAEHCGTCRYCASGRQDLCVRSQNRGWQIDGTLAEYVVVPARSLRRIPVHLSLTEAAALPVAFGTAWNAVVTQGELRPGETVLIHGIGSGVALFALQIAVAMGARVIVTSGSDAKLAQAKELGAAAGVNYRTEPLLERIRELLGPDGADLVLDGVGGETLLTSLRVANRTGRVILYGATSGEVSVSNWLLFHKTIRSAGAAGPAEFDRGLQFIRESGLRPVIAAVHPWTAFESALEELRSQKQFGKIVLTVG